MTYLFKLNNNNLVTFLYSNEVILCNIFDFDTLEEYSGNINRINDIIVKDTMIPFLSKCFDVNELKYTISIDTTDDKKKMITMEAVLESYISIKRNFVFEKVLHDGPDKVNLFKINTLLKQTILGNNMETHSFPHCYDNTILPGSKQKLHPITDSVPCLFSRENKIP